jgi:hypothetical protein
VCHTAGQQAERAQQAHRRVSAAVLTVRRASVLFAAHDPLRPLMDQVLALAASIGGWLAGWVCARRCMGALGGAGQLG